MVPAINPLLAHAHFLSRVIATAPTMNNIAGPKITSRPPRPLVGEPHPKPGQPRN